MDGGRPDSALALNAQFPVISAAAPVTPVPLVCRFVPHDQWFLTHLPPYYQGKDIKSHILSRCLNLSYHPPKAPMPFSSLTDPNQEQRPPSPITFAPHPSARAASPILFASSFLPKNSLVQSSDDDGESVDWDDNLSATKSMSDGERFSDAGRPLDKGKARQMYSDHDEDSVDDGAPPQGGRVLPMKTSTVPSPAQGTSSQPKSRSKPQPKVEDPKYVPKVAHLSFALVRFSTGQVLEDETKLSEQGIQHHELLELHLSFASLRKQPRSTTVTPATAKFPFPLINPPSRASNAKSKRRLQELVAAHTIRLVRLPRAIPQAYILPYWEGWVRILRYVCRDEADYVYAGHTLPLVPGVTSGSTRPGPAQYGSSAFNNSYGIDNMTNVGELRETNLDANLAMNFGLGGRTKEYRPRDRLAHDMQALTSDPHPPTHMTSRFEWRDRWLVVREGWFFLLRNRSDRNPTHRFPLDHLFNLRDADRLTESIESAKGTRRTRDKGRSPDTSSTRPPGPSSRPRDKAPGTPGTHGTRSPSPNSTLKGSPHQSKRDYSSQNQISRHASKLSKSGDPYDEDDEADVKSIEARTPTNRARPHPQSVHQRHQQTHQRQQQSRSSPSQQRTAQRPRRDLSDPAVRSRLDLDTFIPNSKDEADIVGMKIICAKFINPTGPGKSGPDPFDGFAKEEEPNLYTNSGPTLADVVSSVPGGLIGMGLLDERVLEEEARGKKDGGKEKDKGQKTGEHPANRHKSRLSTKVSAQSALSNEFGPGMSGKPSGGSADRRPSLPAIGIPGDRWPTKQTTSLGSLTNAGSSSSNPLSFTGLFKSSKDKEEKRKEKEAKEAKKANKKRAEQERREQEMEYNDGLTSSSNWKLPMGKTKRPKETLTPTSTVGTIDEGTLVIQRYQEEVGSSMRRSSIDTWRTDGTFQATPRREGEPMSDFEARRHGHPRSNRSSISSNGNGYPEPSPIVFKDYGSAEPSPASAAPRFNLNSFSPIATTPSPLAHEGVPSSPPRDGMAPAKPEDGNGSGSDSSISLSSPVFAHDDGSEEEFENDMGLGLPQRRRTGYRYGYQRPDTETNRAGEKEVVEAPPASIEASSTVTVTVSADKPGSTKPKKLTARFESKTRTDMRKSARRGEWIIMDFGNDAAYHSLLRILHRHADQPVTSAFLPDLRHRVDLSSIAKPVAKLSESAGSPPPTPPAKDSTPNQLVPPSPDGNDQGTTMRSTGSSPRSRSHSDAAFLTPRRLSKTGPYSDDENDTRLLRESPIYEHPKPLYPPRLSSRQAEGGDRFDRSHGLGPYPYPEWRLQAVHRAKRAGLGQTNRALEIMLLGMNNRDAEYFDPFDPAFPLEPSPWSEGDQDAHMGDVEDGDQRSEQQPASDADDEDEDDDEVGNPSFNSFNEGDEGEMSEMEWQAWTADLPRQLRLRKERGDTEPAWMKPTAPLLYDDGETTDINSDGSEEFPLSLKGETAMVMRHRRRKEPCGVVTSQYTSTAVEGFVTRGGEHHDNEEHRSYHRIQRYPAASLSAGTLSSPSSSESLSRQHLAGRDPSMQATNDASSIASSPHSVQGHTRGQSQSFTHSLPHKSSRGSNRHSVLHHSSSMQTSLRGTNDTTSPSHQDPATRKASMPVMGSMGSTTTTTVTEQTFTLNNNSFGMVIQELKSPENHPMPTSSSYDSNRYLADPSTDPYGPSSSTSPSIAQHRAPSNVSLASQQQGSSLMRHQSSNRSYPKPNTLRKKSSERDLPPPPISPKSNARPKLSVTTTTNPPPQQQQQQHQQMPSTPPSQAHERANMSVDSLVTSPTMSPSAKMGNGNRTVARSLNVRHVKSGSSLKGGSEDPGNVNTPSASTSWNGLNKDKDKESTKAKKKRSGAFGMFASGLI